ncbi:MAG: alpha/beta hydrolase [Acidobacteriota bacterium]
MTKKNTINPSDLRGISQITIDAIVGITDLVEAIHQNIVTTPNKIGIPIPNITNSIASLVYHSIRGVTKLVGSGIDTIFAQFIPILGEGGTSDSREFTLAALNGVLGDYLMTNNNPLMIKMQLRYNGQSLKIESRALADQIPQPSGKLAVLVHGLCMNDLQWMRRGHNYGAMLANELGYTPIYLHYNTGLHISTNGHAFAELLEVLIKQWPVPIEELIIVSHSMGGLVSRSGIHYGRLYDHTWLKHLHKVIFLGTPHHGAPLERGGNWIDIILEGSPYIAPFARLGKIRSAGITDLRYGNLLDEDWQGCDRFAYKDDQRSVVPLPDGIKCYTIAATIGKQAWNWRDQLLGDGLVPLGSALGQHKDPNRTLSFPLSNQWIEHGINHLDLLNNLAVYAQIKQWLAS